MNAVYRIGDSLTHSYTAEQQRANYDAQARHERYIRDRDAGKTGFKNIQAQNNSAYSQNQYDVQRSRMTDRQQSSIGKASYDAQRSNYNISSHRYTSLNRLASNKRIDLRSISNDQNRSVNRIRQQIVNLQSKNTQDKEKAKQDIRRNLKNTKNRINERMQLIQSLLERKRVTTSKKTESVRTAFESKKDKESKSTLDQIKNKHNMLYDENDRLRKRLNQSGLNEKAKKELRSKITDNAKKILEFYQSYNDKIVKIKTSHTEKMNEDLASIQGMMESYLSQSKSQQESNKDSLKDQLNFLRQTNDKEITRLKSALSKRLTSKQSHKDEVSNRSKSREIRANENYNADKSNIKSVLKRQRTIVDVRTKKNKQEIRSKTNRNISEIESRQKRAR